MYDTFFITGTDTGVGKTWVSRMIADTISGSAPVTYMKPVQTGCYMKDNGQLGASDYDTVMQGASRSVTDFAVHVPYRFEPACSPHLAAQLAGTEISLTHIITCYHEIRQNHTGCMLVEGAGGLMVPLNASDMIVDLIQQLGIAVILVTTPYLGSLNHTFLSIELLRQRQIAVAGVVCNQSRPGHIADEIHRDNVQIISRYIAPVPFLELDTASRNNREIERFCDEIRK